MGDYLTAPGGHVNLEKVDIILAEVGKVEDEVRSRLHQLQLQGLVLPTCRSIVAGDLPVAGLPSPSARRGA